MSILEKIVAEKEKEVKALPLRPATLEHLCWTAQAFGPRRNFLEALRFSRTQPVALIAEIKKASPSAGVICPDFDAVRIARQYEEAGASCLSVLTDAQFFQGCLAYLKAVRNAVRLPLLRKDFIIDPKQITESIEWGADAVLLIVSILSPKQLRDLYELATGSGLAALVEVHDEAELARALELRAPLIGVNNRDLKTFKTDLGTTEKLAARAFKESQVPLTLVAESGIHTTSDVQRVAKAGAAAILVGEALMREGDPRPKVAQLLGPAQG
jgi:indole-3-glycerol phosphate synthase